MSFFKNFTLLINLVKDDFCSELIGMIGSEEPNNFLFLGRNMIIKMIFVSSLGDFFQIQTMKR